MNSKEEYAGLIVPVILAGGTGSRLLPLSRAAQPKQFLPLMGDDSLLISTCRRFEASPMFDKPLIICSSEHQELLAKQLQEAAIVPKAIVLEPTARGTAAAAAIATLFTMREDPNNIILLLAADNYLQQPAAFLESVSLGARAADVGQIVLFGIAPTRADSGFGYIEAGEPIQAAPGVNQVRSFVEKPCHHQAEALLSHGGHLWNSGNFLFRAEVMFREFERLRPDILAACRAALDRAQPTSNGLKLEKSPLAELKVEVIDRAILERSDHAAVVTLDAGWSDVGTWDSVRNVSAKGAVGNSLSGDVAAEAVTGCYIRSESRLVAAIGLTDLVVIETADTVLVACRDSAAETKTLVERLQRLGRSEVLSHPSGAGSWIRQRLIDEESLFSANRIEIAPGAQVSGQVGLGHAEHWVVAQGSACIAFGNERRHRHQNDSIHLAAGAVYHLQNTAAVPLQMVEVGTTRNDRKFQ